MERAAKPDRQVKLDLPARKVSEAQMVLAARRDPLVRRVMSGLLVHKDRLAPSAKRVSLDPVGGKRTAWTRWPAWASWSARTCWTSWPVRASSG